MSAQSLLSLLAPTAPTPSKGATDTVASGFQDLLGAMMAQVQAANDGDMDPEAASARPAVASFLIAPAPVAQPVVDLAEIAPTAILPTDLLAEDAASQPTEDGAELPQPADAAAQPAPAAPALPAKASAPTPTKSAPVSEPASVEPEVVAAPAVNSNMSTIEATLAPPVEDAAIVPEAPVIEAQVSPEAVPSPDLNPAIVAPPLPAAEVTVPTPAAKAATPAAPEAPAPITPLDAAPVPAEPITAPPVADAPANAGKPSAPPTAPTPQQASAVAPLVAPKPKAEAREVAPAASEPAAAKDATAPAEAPAAPPIAPKAEATPMRPLAERTSRPLETEPTRTDATSAAKPSGASGSSAASAVDPARAEAAARPQPASPAVAAAPVDALPSDQMTAGHAADPVLVAEAARAAEAPTPQISRASIDATAQIAAQIIRRLEGRTTRFEMALTPDDLGRVDVKLDIDSEGRLAARLAFDNPLAATDLRGRADELRRQLEQAGFEVSDSALEFAERDSSSSAFDRGQEQRGGQGRAFAAASRLNADTDIAAQPPRWTALSLSPSGVDLKV